MFTAMYDNLVLKQATKDCNTKVSCKTVEISRRNIEMFLTQLDQSNQFTEIDINQAASTLEHSFKLLLILDKHLDHLIILNTEDNLNSISGQQFSEELLNTDKLRNIQYLANKKVIHKNHFDKTSSSINHKIKHKINSLNCLFTWNLQTSTSKKDLISLIRKKYGNYNLDIGLPFFTFERYISNIIIGYELFCTGKIETSKLVVMLIGKWLEELDKSNDEFYLSISNGLKYVLSSTFVHIMLTSNSTKNIEWLLNIVVPFSDMNSESKATIYAIQAAVLIEYGDNEDNFKKASECSKIACNLNPDCSYWFYLHSIVLTAYRHFTQTYQSCPTLDEKNAIKQAIKLSKQNIYILYQEMLLFKDTVFNNFHRNKKDQLLPDNKNVSDNKKIVQMIKALVSMQPKDPLIFVNCARILMTLPKFVRDLNLGKQLLTEGLQMASDDLIILKAITQVIILCKKKIIPKGSSVIINQPIENHQMLRTSNQINFFEDLKLAVEKHNGGENPVPYLVEILNSYDNHIQRKILAQICSYTILFSDDLKSGIDYFMMLIETEQNKLAKSNLIMHHYSSFVHPTKKFNLAKLVNNEIKLALIDNTIEDKNYCYNVLAKIRLIYQIDDVDGDGDRSMIYKLTGKSKKNKSQSLYRTFENSVNQIVVNRTSAGNHFIQQETRRKNKNSRRSRNKKSSSNVDENDEYDDEDGDEGLNNNDCCRII